MSTNAHKAFATRRRRLMRRMGRDAIAILPAAPERPRNGTTSYPYRQASDFWYLTGFVEPEAILVLAPGRDEGEALLFCRPRDPERERWEGVRSGPEGAVADYGLDAAEPIETFAERLPELLAGRHAVYHALNVDAALDRTVLDALDAVRARSRAGVHAPEAIIAPQALLHEMRLIKGRDELQRMRHAARISAAAHVRAMRTTRPGMAEYQIEAELLHEFVRHGCRAPAYPSIVAGGANACVLHYHDNRAVLADGDLLLIDAGGEYDHYAADITRTFPVNGRFSGPQRAITELVLAAQQAAIEAVRPGHDWNRPHEAAVRVLTEGLVELKILRGSVDDLIEQAAYKPYYMHRTGHWLGLDVHDVGEYQQAGQWRELRPGMALTVEPALYFPADIEGLDPRWHHIGVRIEDDVVVTRDGCEVLTEEAPKAPDAIEELMGEGR